MSDKTDLYLIFHADDKTSISSIESYFNESGLTVHLGADFYNADGEYDRNCFLEEHQAMVSSRSVIVCIGASGLGKSQDKMVEAVFGAEARKENNIYVCLVGKERTFDEIPPDLGGLVAHYYPKRNTLSGAEPGLALIAKKMHKMKNVDAKGAGIEEDVHPDEKNKGKQVVLSAFERRIREFKKKASRENVAIVLGTNWNEVTGGGPNQTTIKLLKEIYNDSNLEIDAGAIMSLERAAYCYSIIAADNQQLSEELGAPRSSEAFSMLAHLAKTYTLKEENQPGKSKRSFVFFDTNVDACLDRELIKKQIPYVSYVPLGDGDYIQTSIDEIERTEDGAYRISGQRDEDGRGDRSEKIVLITDDYDVTRDSHAFDDRKKAMSTPGGECLLNDEEILMDISIDMAMCEFHEFVGLRCERTSRDTDLMRIDNMVAKIRMEALDSFKPVVIKPFGCSHVADSTVYSLDKMIKLGSAEKWIPRSFEAAMGQAHLTFIGFNAIDQNFVYLYNKMFLPLFLENRSRSKSDWLRLFIALKPNKDEVSSNTLNEMITDILDQDSPSTVDFDNIRFLTTSSLPEVIDKLSLTE